MAGSRTGTPTIVALARKICKLVSVYGAGNLSSATTPQFAAAIATLMIACAALETVDDLLLQIDRTAPFGPEDQQPG